MTVGVVALLLSAACTDDETRLHVPDHTLTRDSAGVRVVVNEPVPDKEVLLVASSFRLRIGSAGDDDATALFRVTGAQKTVNDEIVIANAGSAELRFFDLEGNLTRAVGGRGSGPGEFEDLKQLTAYRSDSIAAYDWGSRRISIWGATGELGRTIPLMPIIQGPAELVGALSDGSFIVSTMSVVRFDDRVREEVSYIWVDSEGDEGSELLRVPVREYAPSESRGQLPRPFAPALSAAIYEDRLLVGNGESFEIRVVELSGEVSKIIRKNVEPEPVSPEDEAAFKRMVLSHAPSPEVRRETEASFSDIVFPPFKPSYVTFVTGQSEYLWVLDHPKDLEADRFTWSVFDSRGHLIGSVQVPAIIVMNGTIGPDFILGVALDDHGVEYVELYEIQVPDS